MRRVLALVLLLGVALWLVVEVVAPPYAESRMEEQILARSRGTTAVTADLGTFPVVARLVTSGTVPRLSVTLDELAGQQLTISEVTFDLRGIVLDRAAMFGGDVRVRDIDHGVVTVAVDVAAMQEALGGAPVRITPDGIAVFTPAGEVTVMPRLEGRTLTLSVSGVADLSLTLPEGLVPCDATLALDGDRIVATCTIEAVPAVLRGA